MLKITLTLSHPWRSLVDNPVFGLIDFYLGFVVHWLCIWRGLLIVKVTSCRSSRLEVLCTKGVLTNFAKYTAKHQGLH